MASAYVFLVFLCCVFDQSNVVLAIRDGNDVYHRRIHNKPMVFLAVRNGWFSAGNLVHRSFVLTSALSIPTHAEDSDIIVRIGSLHSFEGGVLRGIDQRVSMGAAQNDRRMVVTLARLCHPFDSPFDVSLAFLAIVYLRPQGFVQGEPQVFVVSGWHRGSSTLQPETTTAYSLNHRLNTMMVKESNAFVCAKDYYNVDRYVTDQVDVMGCYCPVTCAVVCSTGQFPGEVDNGAGFFLRNTNLLLGVAQSLVQRKREQVNAIMSYTDMLQPTIVKFITRDQTDEFDDYPEYDPGQGLL